MGAVEIWKIWKTEKTWGWNRRRWIIKIKEVQRKEEHKHLQKKTGKTDIHCGKKKRE